MPTAKINWRPVIVIAAVGLVCVVALNFMFGHVQWLRELFSASSGGPIGEVAPDSGESLAARAELTGRISMLIFAVITVLQCAAFALGYAVVGAIRRSDEPASLKLVRLETSEIFFDVPLYVGLFGTVSAFLVMTFSPQSSRLIAYSSTLIGIIFSLVLRIILQYPLRQRLEGEKAGVEKK
ncbi:MAG: hypothetical protein MJ025_04735 [Victivallaceae bacterium]|nr:hypothetical protein [Victivallaceae bacterium]